MTLKLNTRYILKYQDTEKVISINNPKDLEYWSAKAGQEGYEFREVVIHDMKEPCPSCQG